LLDALISTSSLQSDIRQYSTPPAQPKAPLPTNAQDEQELIQGAAKSTRVESTLTILIRIQPDALPNKKGGPKAAFTDN